MTPFCHLVAHLHIKHPDIAVHTVHTSSLDLIQMIAELWLYLKQKIFERWDGWVSVVFCFLKHCRLSVKEIHFRHNYQTIKVCGFISRVVTLMLPDLAAFCPSVASHAINSEPLRLMGHLRWKPSPNSMSYMLRSTKNIPYRRYLKWYTFGIRINESKVCCSCNHF